MRDVRAPPTGNKEEYDWLAQLMGSYFYVKDTQAKLLIVKRLRAMYTSLVQLAPVRCTLSCG